MADDRIRSTRTGRCQDHLSSQSIKAERGGFDSLPTAAWSSTVLSGNILHEDKGMQENEDFTVCSSANIVFTRAPYNDGAGWDLKSSCLWAILPLIDACMLSSVSYVMAPQTTSPPYPEF